MDLSRRVRAVCDLDVAEMREYSGRHEYDGKPQDLSGAGVRAGLARLAQARATGERAPDAHDEAQLTAAEDQKRVIYATLELHRRNPLLHLGELDLACYDRDYAPLQRQYPRLTANVLPGMPRPPYPQARQELGHTRSDSP